MHDEYNSNDGVSENKNSERPNRSSPHRLHKRLEFLMNTKLRGKVRMRIAGDVHNYMRHVPQQQQKQHDTAGEGAPMDNSTSANVFRHPLAPAPPPTLVISGGGGAFLHPTHAGLGCNPLYNVAGTQGTDYTRAVAYPDVKHSRALSYQNLFKFRNRNWRFDMIGGVLYVLLAHPLFTGCPLSSMSSTTISNTNTESSSNVFVNFVKDIVLFAIPRLLSESMWSTMFVLVLWYGMVSAVDSRKLGVRFWWGSLHCACHVCSAVGVTVLIDLILESLAKYGNLGNGGLNLQWDLFQAKFAAGSGTMGFIDAVGTFTMNIVPTVLRYSMYVADSPQTQYLVRHYQCNNVTVKEASASIYSDQLMLVSLLLRVIWYWILACPVVSTVIAGYLWLSVGFLNMHWNEGFSSLQHTGYKNFVKMKIKKNGDLEMYVVGIDVVPTNWTKDVLRKKKEKVNCGAEERGVNGIFSEQHHYLKRPSKWVKSVNGKPSKKEIGVRIVDHFVLHRV